MALKFRRGSTQQQSGSLVFGEPFVNTTLNTLLIGGESGDIQLVTTTQTASFATSAITSSSLTTASFSGNTLTFTKGNGTQFGIVIPDVSGSSGPNINTGSLATTGSNTFIGNQTISGSLTISGSSTIRGNQTISGSSTFTGSTLGNIVSMSIVSNTASMDFNAGNYFTLRLNSGSIPTRLNPTNVRAGQTISLVVTQAATLSGSLSFPTIFKFPTGSYYTASRVINAMDVLTFITVDTASIHAVSVKGMGL